MNWKNTPQNWGLLARLLHWLVAFGWLGLAALGLIMVNAIHEAGQKFDLYQAHKTFGFLFLVLLILRAGWRLASKAPQLRGRTPFPRLAGITHGALLILPFAQVFSGWLMVSASPLPIPIHLFGSLDVPALIAPNAAAEILWRNIHHAFAFLLLAVVGLHICGALWHRLAQRRADV